MQKCIRARSRTGNYCWLWSRLPAEPRSQSDVKKLGYYQTFCSNESKLGSFLLSVNHLNSWLGGRRKNVEISWRGRKFRKRPTLKDIGLPLLRSFIFSPLKCECDSNPAPYVHSSIFLGGVLSTICWPFLEMVHSRPLFPHFHLFYLNVQLVDKILPMLGFELQISGVGSDHSINWAATIAHAILVHFTQNLLLVNPFARNFRKCRDSNPGLLWVETQTRLLWYQDRNILT